MSWNAREFRKWTNDTIADVDIGELDTIEGLLSVPARNMMGKSLDEVHDVVTRLAQYGIFITNQLNSARASSKYYEKEFKERLAVVMTTGAVKGKSREEREMNAVQIDEELHDLYNQMKEYKIKAERIEGLPYVISTYFSVINEIFRLKLGERKYGSKEKKE